MAGRLEEVINNKFYFVLDEVGASDCESELGSENSGKGHDNVSHQVKVADDHVQSEKNTSTDTPEDYIKNKNFRLPNPLTTATLEEKNYLRNDEAEEVKDKDSNLKPAVPAKSSTAVELEEKITIVDMDIDSENEYADPPTSSLRPLIKITFHDQGAEKLIKGQLIKFFHQKLNEIVVIDCDQGKLEIYEKDSVKLMKNDLVSFDMDTTPTHGNSSEVPHYGKNHNFILSDKSPEGPETPKHFASSKRTCFNCLQSHNLKDCPEIKDFRAIHRNRMIFQNEMKNSKVSRYHLDEAQRFSNVQPGVISKKLRNALNLKSDQIPTFIYRMRLLGYPPAWLEEAKVSHSGVVMYDSKGCPVLEDDEEEGEIIVEGSKDKFDIAKLIEFPGFNVPLPQNFKEEGKFHGCPEMSQDQSKENLINLLKPKTVQAYVKKSLVTKSDDTQEDSRKRPLSPTIEEMEEKKRQLLMELDDEEESGSKLNSEDSSSGTGPETEASQGSQGIREPGTVRNSEFGTPILKSFSPFSKLPSREQFSVNVSDVINFENLPNSTGKYETMRHVITKIRTSTSKMQDN